MSDPTDAKRAVRRTMYEVVRSMADRNAASVAICGRLEQLDVAASAETVMVYDALPTEVDPAAFAAWCVASGKRVAAPIPEPTAEPPIDPTDVDLVVVPGLAFTADGRRLGRGGGWYDRFLTATRDDCVLIGICHDAQLLDDLPTEPHDVRMDLVVTPTRTLTA